MVDTMYDSVDHPKHYTLGSIECIDAIKESMTFDSFCGYLKGNILKYLWRYQNKDNPIQDLKKAQWYLTKLIEVMELKEIDRYDP